MAAVEIPWAAWLLSSSAVAPMGAEEIPVAAVVKIPLPESSLDSWRRTCSRPLANLHNLKTTTKVKAALQAADRNIQAVWLVWWVVYLAATNQVTV